jgi:hypothetical protein
VNLTKHQVDDQGKPEKIYIDQVQGDVLRAALEQPAEKRRKELDVLHTR